jgi:hypothetical protein
MNEAPALAAFRAEYINSNELKAIYGVGRYIFRSLIRSGALTVADSVRVYRRRPALECFDMKFS